MTENPKSCADRIRDAHAKGHLFVHMFELQNNEFYQRIPNMLKVLAGEEGAEYHSIYQIHHTSDGGFLGLATTALNAQYPVALFNLGLPFGLLFDSARPLVVGGNNIGSRVDGRNLGFSVFEGDQKIQDVQGLRGLPYLDTEHYNQTPRRTLALDDNLDARVAMAEAGLTALWQEIDEKGWDVYCSSELQRFNRGMNEVLVAAKMQDACGIIIDTSHLLAPANQAYALIQFNLALETQSLIKRTYNIDLPLVEYRINRSVERQESTPTLEVMSEDRIKEIHATISKEREGLDPTERFWH